MVVVTGANGFIGSAMVWELNQAGITDVVACDTITPQERPNPLEGLSFSEFLKKDELFSWLENQSTPPTCIFHMGASSATDVMDEEFLKENNTEYTKTLFQYCEKNNVKFIYASSASVYGDGSNGFDDKTSSKKYTPMHPYGWSKANFDIWAEDQPETQNKWFGLRFFNVYGPNEYHKGKMLSVPFRAYHQIKEEGCVKLFKSYHPDYAHGEQMRDFVYIKDITRWMLELSKENDAASGVYNMGYGRARTWKDLVNSAFSALNKESHLEWIEIPEHLKNQYQYFTEADMEKWKKAGLSEPQWPVEKGVGDYVKNYLENGPSNL